MNVCFGPDTDINALPNDPRLLKDLLRQAQGELKEKQTRIDELSHTLAQLERWKFGRRSEIIPREQLLFAFVRAFDVPERPARPPASPSAPRKKAAPHGRRIIPDHLPRERTLIDLPPEDKKCVRCCHDLVTIGQDVSSQLDYEPGRILVRETIRPRWACNNCEGNKVKIADLPVQPIARCLAAPGLLAWTIVQKYQFHIPLYRQSAIYASQGIDLSDSTLGGWIGRSADVLEPVHQAMKKDVLSSEVMNTDDSPMRVLDRDLKHRSRQGRLHTHIGDSNHRHVVYMYSPNHKYHWAQDFLASYRGFLQADAWKGYDELFKKGGATEVACWAHSRRYFFEALQTDNPRAMVALTFIHRLYEIEDQARGFSAPERLRMREAFAVPVLGAFKEWIDAEALKVTPRTPIAKALRYAREQWDALNLYCTDGRLNIDNNVSERTLRGPVLGEKNWMFFGSDEGGRWAAIHYSLIESAKLHGKNPFEYLRDVISRIATHPARRILELTPAYWKPRGESPNTS